MKGKVIQLPYTFKTILPSLRGYVDKLKQAQDLERQAEEDREPGQNALILKECLESLIQCEHMERATEIFDDIEPNLISQEEWASTLEIVIHGLLHEGGDEGNGGDEGDSE